MSLADSDNACHLGNREAGRLREGLSESNLSDQRNMLDAVLNKFLRLSAYVFESDTLFFNHVLELEMCRDGNCDLVEGQDPAQ
ncbi:hypothetical protein PCANC_22007 [Puccinia coronata f. sp. avenae]|uniref:Uncharacterized protein n=1 Tax=Puccinia coronata f. sp. avenae TaxID=200324 RepID=A0A2N5SFD6_9BASI|nr:hypothetical protein PCANC_22007 [Puccinia coronata f. sp. avenae]